MTATQAPTPGPLSGDDVNRECKACGAFKPDFNAACTFCGLAPTAPVEASGSERETEHFRQMVEAKLAEAVRADHADAPFPMDEHQAASYHRTRADLLGWVLDMLPSVDGPLIPIRPQPSGETREDVARELWDYQIAARRKKSLSIPKELGSRILALLSARPLASGGQHSSGEESQ
ncbi:hypothetical protein [Brevundimonas sp.]|uniref:hypothetical protein n=1 Tax=Brevundimonas sp. TaxID=1871086 RepID=UPI0028AD6C08|nr:hypothetical protein [Brevundimonas sp.]